jgi:hypothetical protein
MIDTDKYEGLTIDDWYKMNHHDWKDVVNEHNDLLAEVKRLREENKMLLHGINDAISMSSSGAKTPVADGSIKHYFPLYLLEMIE